MMKISEIEWGNDSAEKDPNLLKYFIPLPAIERLLKRTKTFVIGRKGLGKSALRRKILEETGGWADNYFTEVMPTYQIFSSIINDSDINRNFNTDMFFQYVWLKFLYRKALIEIGQRPLNAQNPVFTFAIELARSNEQAPKSFLDVIREFVSALKIKAGNLGEFGINVEKELRKEAEIDVYEHHLKKILDAGYYATWLVDDLDLGWNNSPISNNLLLGLLLCSSHVKEISQHLHILIFMREDAYRILLTHTTHSDKYRDIEKISWNQDALVEMLSERIRFNFKSRNISIEGNVFNKVFPENVGKSITQNWLVERTLNRPRELIQFARIYSEKNDTTTPDSDILKDSELEYSNWKLEDLCTEYSNQYPNLLNLFNVWKTKFYRQKYHLKFEEFEEIYLEIQYSANIDALWFREICAANDAKVLLKILYEVGVVGDYILGGQGGSKIFYSFLEVHEPVFTEIQIHPCFRKALGTVDRIR